MKAISLLQAIYKSKDITKTGIIDMSTEDATDRKDHIIATFGTDKLVCGKTYRHKYLFSYHPLQEENRKEMKADIILRDDESFIYLYKIEE